ncbi:unnamed protein product [Owenia fusiformis]|uniref:Uncharacterized protein n=1 Tax=Owenia fusiformis TaxID=6347 RepID=A0A8S4NWC1_OWEFU|nr:unnamed protein product [Owenia fusiformis]
MNHFNWCAPRDNNIIMKVLICAVILLLVFASVIDAKKKRGKNPVCKKADITKLEGTLNSDFTELENTLVSDIVALKVFFFREIIKLEVKLLAKFEELKEHQCCTKDEMATTPPAE